MGLAGSWFRGPLFWQAAYWRTLSLAPGPLRGARRSFSEAKDARLASAGRRTTRETFSRRRGEARSHRGTRGPSRRDIRGIMPARIGGRGRRQAHSVTSKGLAISSAEDSGCTKEGEHHVESRQAVLASRVRNLILVDDSSCVNPDLRPQALDSVLGPSSSLIDLYSLVVLPAVCRSGGRLSFSSRGRLRSHDLSLDDFFCSALSCVDRGGAPCQLDLRPLYCAQHCADGIRIGSARLGFDSSSGSSCGWYACATPAYARSRLSTCCRSLRQFGSSGGRTGGRRGLKGGRVRNGRGGRARC